MTHAAQCRERTKQRALDAIGRECVFYGSSEDLHAAHVKPTGLKGPSRGKRERYKDVAENPDCYRPMCKDCHRTFDALRSLWRPEIEKPIPF